MTLPEKCGKMAASILYGQHKIKGAVKQDLLYRWSRDPMEMHRFTLTLEWKELNGPTDVPLQPFSIDEQFEWWQGYWEAVAPRRKSISIRMSADELARRDWTRSTKAMTDREIYWEGLSHLRPKARK